MVDPKMPVKPFVVDRLDRLRIVGDAKTGIARAARVVIFERERLQIGVEIGAQLEQRLQPDLHEQIIRDPIDDSPKKLDHDQRETKNQNEAGNRLNVGCLMERARVRQNLVDNDLERPRLEQVQTDPAMSESKNPDRGLRPEWPVVTKDAAVDRHGNLRLQIADFRLNYRSEIIAEAKSEIRNPKSEIPECIIFLKSGLAGS